MWRRVLTHGSAPEAGPIKAMLDAAVNANGRPTHGHGALVTGDLPR